MVASSVRVCGMSHCTGMSPRVCKDGSDQSSSDRLIRITRFDSSGGGATNVLIASGGKRSGSFSDLPPGSCQLVGDLNLPPLRRHLRAALRDGQIGGVAAGMNL